MAPGRLSICSKVEKLSHQKIVTIIEEGVKKYLSSGKILKTNDNLENIQQSKGTF